MMITIPRKPSSTPQPATQHQDRKAEVFIAKADHKPQSAKPYSTTLRIPSDLLTRIDAAAHKKHITRSAWIKATLSEVFDRDG